MFTHCHILCCFPYTRDSHRRVSHGMPYAYIQQKLSQDCLYKVCKFLDEIFQPCCKQNLHTVSISGSIKQQYVQLYDMVNIVDCPVFRRYYVRRSYVQKVIFLVRSNKSYNVMGMSCKCHNLM